MCNMYIYIFCSWTNLNELMKETSELLELYKQEADFHMPPQDALPNSSSTSASTSDIISKLLRKYK
jgi:hypothetical protein